MNANFTTSYVNQFTGKTVAKNLAARLNDAEIDRIVIKIGGQIVDTMTVGEHWTNFQPKSYIQGAGSVTVADVKEVKALHNISTDDKKGEMFGDHGFMVDCKLENLANGGYMRRIGVVEAGYAGKYADMFGNAIPDAVVVDVDPSDVLRSIVEKSEQKRYDVAFNGATKKFLVAAEMVKTELTGDFRMWIDTPEIKINSRLIRFDAFQKLTSGQAVHAIWNDRFDNYANVKALQGEMTKEELVADEKARIGNKAAMGHAAKSYGQLAAAIEAAPDVMGEDGVVSKDVDYPMPSKTVRVLVNGAFQTMDLASMPSCILHYVVWGNVVPNDIALGDDLASRSLVSLMAANGVMFSM